MMVIASQSYDLYQPEYIEEEEYLRNLEQENIEL